MREDCYNCILHGNCTIVPKDGFCYAWYPDDAGEFYCYVDRFKLGVTSSSTNSRFRSVKNRRDKNGELF